MPELNMPTAQQQKEQPQKEQQLQPKFDNRVQNADFSQQDI